MALSMNASYIRAFLLRAESAYRLGLPEVMTDDEYDSLKALYEKSVSETIDFTSVAGHSTKEVVEYIHPMLSIDTAHDGKQLSNWLAKIATVTPAEPVCMEYKVDGIAVELLYFQGALVRALTRYDRESGLNITANVMKTKVPKVIDTKQNYVLVRGELMIFTEDFLKIKESHGYSNPRNAVAGLALTAQADAPLHAVDFIAYRLLDSEDTQDVDCSYLAKMGFNTALINVIRNDMEMITAEFRKVEARRNELPYEIDGVVIKSRVHGAVEEATYKNVTNNAIALKFSPMAAIAEVLGVTWSMGTKGALTPVVELSPIKIGGVEITNVSASNAGILHSLNIGYGSLVKIERRGDVIPYIGSVVNRPDPISSYTAPMACPYCSGHTELTDGKILRCVNAKNYLVTECTEYAVQQLTRCFSEHALGFKGFSTSFVEQLVNHHLAMEPLDLFTLDPNGASKLPLTRDKTKYGMLLMSMEVQKTHRLDNLLYMLNLEHVGKTLSRELCFHVTSLNTLLCLDTLTPTDWMAMISKTDVIRGNALHATFNSPYFKSCKYRIKQLVNSGKISIHFSTPPRKDLKRVCISGTFKMSRALLVEALLDKGYKAIDTVNSKTDYVLFGDKPTQRKVEAARALSIPTLTLDVLEPMKTQIYTI